jgi:sulfur carrier protein
VRKHGVNVTAETKEIGIVLNGEPRRIPQGLNVAGLLKFLEIEGGKVAVELNREIVRKPEWESANVGEGAQVEVVWFVGGGSSDGVCELSLPKTNFFDSVSNPPKINSYMFQTIV